MSISGKFKGKFCRSERQICRFRRLYTFNDFNQLELLKRQDYPGRDILCRDSTYFAFWYAKKTLGRDWRSIFPNAAAQLNSPAKRSLRRECGQCRPSLQERDFGSYRRNSRSLGGLLPFAAARREIRQSARADIQLKFLPTSNLASKVQETRHSLRVRALMNCLVRADIQNRKNDIFRCGAARQRRKPTQAIGLQNLCGAKVAFISQKGKANWREN